MHWINQNSQRSQSMFNRYLRIFLRDSGTDIFWHCWTQNSNFYYITKCIGNKQPMSLIINLIKIRHWSVTWNFIPDRFKTRHCLEQFGDNSCQQNDATQLSKHQTLHSGHHIGDECYFSRRFWFAVAILHCALKFVLVYPNSTSKRSKCMRKYKKMFTICNNKTQIQNLLDLCWTSVLHWKLPNTSYLPL